MVVGNKKGKSNLQSGKVWQLFSGIIKGSKEKRLSRKQAKERKNKWKTEKGSNRIIYNLTEKNSIYEHTWVNRENEILFGACEPF